MQLVCMFVGVTPKTIIVEVDPHAMIGQLKQLINAQLPKRLALDAAIDLELFAARRGVHWLSDTSREVAEIEAGGYHSVQDLLQQRIKQNRILETIFVDLAPNTIHVLVRDPRITLVCLRVGVPGHVFDVKVDLNAPIRDLRTAIMKVPELEAGDAKAMDVELYVAKRDGTCLSQSNMETLKAGVLDDVEDLMRRPITQSSGAATTVASVFGNPLTDSPPESIHVLVWNTLHRPHRAELASRDKHSPARRKRWTELNAILARNPKMRLDGLVGMSYVQWPNVAETLKSVKYEQEECEDLPIEHVELIH